MTNKRHAENIGTVKREIDIDNYCNKLEEAGIIGNKEQDVIDNEDGTYEVTTDVAVKNIF